jgi:hypothetical protein
MLVTTVPLREEKIIPQNVLVSQSIYQNTNNFISQTNAMLSHTHRAAKKHCIVHVFNSINL